MLTTTDDVLHCLNAIGAIEDGEDSCTGRQRQTMHDDSRRTVRERRAWTSEEDECILNMVKEHGCLWRQHARTLQRTFGTRRSDDAIRNRWNRLHFDCNASKGPAPRRTPTLLRKSWTSDDDAVIMRMVQRHGRQWDTVQKALPGRTSHAIRNRFDRIDAFKGTGAIVDESVDRTDPDPP